MDNSIFVGRKTQLDELNSHWRDAFHKKQGKVVFLMGEAGIGKTSLVEQFSRSVLKNYSVVQYAYAQCDQVAGDISPYAPFVQVLNSLTEQAAKHGDNWFVSYMREVGPDVLGMVPVAGPLLTASAKSVDFVWQRRKQTRVAEADRSRFGQQDLFQQFTDTFRNIAANKNPLLLCIDDWHWADASSTNLLFHLARQLSDVPLLLLATYRPHDAEVHKHPILNVRTEMERYSLCASLELDFLSRTEVEIYLAQRFPEAHFAPEFVNWLLQTTSGNALFITEYLNLLLNEGLLSPDGQLTGDLADLQPPLNVEVVIRTRLGYMDREARDMLAYASVEGVQFTTLGLSHLLGIKPLSLFRKLRAIQETHQLIASLGQQSVYGQQTTVYHFLHSLIHRALYNMLEEEERVEIGGLLLKMWDKIYARVSQVTRSRLAPQLMAYAAEAKDYRAKAHYALAAASVAAMSFAHAEVLKHCTIGLQALDKLINVTDEVQTLQIDLLLRLANTQDFIGEWPKALKTYAKAESLITAYKDTKNLVGVLISMGWTSQVLGKHEMAEDFYKKALSKAEQLGDQTCLAQAHGSMGVIQEKLGNYMQALVEFQKERSIWEDLKNESGIASAYNWIGNVYTRLGNYESALEYQRKSMVINEKLDDKPELGWNYNSLGSIHRKQCNYSQALKFYQQALMIWEELDFKRGKALTLRNLGLLYMDKHEFDKACEWFQEAFAISEKLGYRSGVAWNYNYTGVIYQYQGDNSQALRQYQKGLVIFRESGEKRGQADTVYNIGRVFENQADYSQALDHYREALTIREDLDNPQDIAETRQRIAEVEAKLVEQENKE